MHMHMQSLLWVSAHVHNWPSRVGKGCQQHVSKLHNDAESDARPTGLCTL